MKEKACVPLDLPSEPVKISEMAAIDATEFRLNAFQMFICFEKWKYQNSNDVIFQGVLKQCSPDTLGDFFEEFVMSWM